MNQTESTTFNTFTNVDEFIKINLASDSFEANEEPSEVNLFTTYFQQLQPEIPSTHSSNLDIDEYQGEDIKYKLKNDDNLMLGHELESPLTETTDFKSTLNQFTTLPYLTPSTSSIALSSASVENYASLSEEFNENFTENNYSIDMFSEVEPVYETTFDDHNHSPLSMNGSFEEVSKTFKSQISTVPQFNYTTNPSPNDTSISSDSQNQLQNIRKSSLDSRLSLQRLGEILKTSSPEETMKIEKFILNIFGKELGFPLGYKTWIRDTTENYRRYLLDEVYKRVNPTYPELTKNLLETVIKRATYSMMQGRLRKERRALTKANKKKNLK